MALLKSIVKTMPGFSGELRSEPLYWKVDRIEASKNSANAIFNAYDKKDGSLVDGTIIKFSPDLSGENFIRQAYQYIKNLPEFAGSVDC